MDIAFIPNWLIRYLSKDYFRQNELNILISNTLIILFFLIFKNGLIDYLKKLQNSVGILIKRNS